jgi:transposase
MKKEAKLYVNANDVATMLGISLGTSYRVIRRLNAELTEKGYITFSGKLPRKYLEERYFGGVTCGK